MGELLRLFERGLPLSELRAEQLGPQGGFYSAESADGAARRNSMHNRVLADVFVTAGGRPSTINGSNWRDFLLPDGTPSALTLTLTLTLSLTLILTLTLTLALTLTPNPNPNQARPPPGRSSRVPTSS